MQLNKYIIIALLQLCCVAVESKSQQTNGILYHQYDVDFTTDVEWDIAPEALEVGTARGVLGSFLIPLDEIGPHDPENPPPERTASEYVDSIDNELGDEVTDLQSYIFHTGQEALLEVQDPDGEFEEPTSLNAADDISENLIEDNTDSIITWEYREEIFGAHHNQIMQFIINLMPIKAALNLTEENTTFPNEYIIDFSTGILNIVYRVIRASFGFTYALTIFGICFKMVRGIF